MNAPVFGIPVIVLSRVDDDQFASFYVAWSIATVVIMAMSAATMALHVEGGRDGAQLARQLRLSISLTVAATTTLALLSAVAAPIIPWIYGEDFQLAADLLPWFLTGAIPWGVTLLLLAHARVVMRHASSLGIATANALFCLVSVTHFTDERGIRGTAIGWVVGTVLAAISAAWIAWLHREEPSIGRTIDA
jgi:O-antigen/teichoic acid export membrane protein